MGRLGILVLVLLAAACSRGNDTSSTESLRYDRAADQQRVADRLAAGDAANLAAESFDQMFDVASKLLVKRGHQDLANQLKSEWRQTYRAKLLSINPEDAGDHQPLSQWVEGWYQKLYDVLGDRLMELSHLKDIWVLNYTIPVVFHRSASSQWCSEELARYPDDTCKAEYARHFVGTKYPKAVDPYANIVTHHGFSGVVTYWAIWAGCEAATYGTGWFIVCSPIGDLGEIAMEKWVAPKISDDLYDRANQ